MTAAICNSAETITSSSAHAVLSYLRQVRRTGTSVGKKRRQVRAARQSSECSSGPPSTPRNTHSQRIASGGGCRRTDDARHVVRLAHDSCRAALRKHGGCLVRHIRREPDDDGCVHAVVLEDCPIMRTSSFCQFGTRAVGRSANQHRTSSLMQTTDCDGWKHLEVASTTISAHIQERGAT